jgi:Cyclin D1 binding domain
MKNLLGVFSVVTAVSTISSSVVAFTSLVPHSRTTTTFITSRITPGSRSRLSLFLDRDEGSMSNQQQQQQYPDDQPRRRITEFMDLEPLEEPEQRRRRLEEDNKVRSQFVAFGDDLWDLRQDMDKLANELIEAITNEQEAENSNNNNNNMHTSNNEYILQKDGFVARSSSSSSSNKKNKKSSSSKEEHLARERLRQVERRDPELVYAMELHAAQMAERQEGRSSHDAIVAQHLNKAAEARRCLPQFNLEGLWVGKYGSNGYEMINVTYVGDTLIAEKVTGDKNVPRGELTFQVDLNPLRFHNNNKNNNNNNRDGGGSLGGLVEPNSSSMKHLSALSSLLTGALQPIVLTDRAARKWGTRQLPRYGGMGQVAEEGFVNNQWMDGQLIIIGDEYFSFAWIPIEQQIFFGRPSPELALKMLRDHGVVPLRSTAKHFTVPPSLDDNVEVQKEFVTRCMEMTDEVLEDDDYSQFPDTAGESVFE